MRWACQQKDQQSSWKEFSKNSSFLCSRLRKNLWICLRSSSSFTKLCSDSCTARTLTTFTAAYGRSYRECQSIGQPNKKLKIVRSFQRKIGRSFFCPKEWKSFNTVSISYIVCWPQPLGWRILKRHKVISRLKNFIWPCWVLAKFSARR